MVTIEGKLEGRRKKGKTITRMDQVNRTQMTYKRIKNIAGNREEMKDHGPARMSLNT